jgi:hypothetical protein
MRIQDFCLFNKIKHPLFVLLIAKDRGIGPYEVLATRKCRVLLPTTITFVLVER